MSQDPADTPRRRARKRIDGLEAFGIITAIVHLLVDVIALVGGVDPGEIPRVVADVDRLHRQVRKALED